MLKDKNNKDLDLSDNQLAKENEIIEEIINNPLLLKNIEELEEEEDEDSYSEKDKITEEILDNKLSFIIPEENESKEKENKNYIKKNSQKIHKDIIDNLLIELFEYHYNEISTEKKRNLGTKILESKYHIEFFCTKLNKNFSKYILLILEQKIYDLIEHVEKLIKTKEGYIPFELVQNVDLENKRILLFCTSGGSSVDKSVENLSRQYPNIKIEKGKRFTGNESDEEYKSWIK